MARVKKQLLNLLETLSAADIKALHEKLAGPKLKALTQEKASLEKKLQAVNEQLAALQGAAPPRKRRKRRVRRAPKAAKARKAAPARKRVRKGKTMAGTIENILAKAGAPMRFKQICDALVRAGHPKTQSLTNYVNRVLSVSPQFVKPERGLYALKGGAAAPPKKKAAKKAGKKAAKKRVRRAKKKAAPKKKAAAPKKKATK